MVDGISIWGDGMTATSGFLDAGGLEVDVVGADGYGGVGSGVAGWIRGSESGGGAGGDGLVNGWV